jgi:formylglycine-generating enzyme required for sulfatase activity
VRIAHIIAAAWLILLGAVAPGHAQKRVALVVGNAGYVHADRLANPVNDARAMRDALIKLGFDVTYGEDLDLKALRQKIGHFAGRVDGADVALVYFAGHGATFGDVPYVVPVDTEFKNLDEVPYELVSVETLIGELRRAKGVRIAILDACRDNGAEQALKRSRGGAATRGLAPMQNPTGLIIAYATQHGATAADSAGSRNSPFTAALLNNIATPGLDVKEMFFKVGSEVDAATGGRQQPEISISMYERYALAPGAGGLGGATPGGSAVVSDAERTWGMIQHTTDLAVLDDYIRQFGDVPIYGPLARGRREQVIKNAAVPPPVKPAVPADDACRGPVTAAFASRCAVPLTAVQERALKPKDTFRECESCPEMVVAPAGAFTMGSPESEPGRYGNEGPQHVVTISRPFAVGKLHVTVDQFAAFVHETGYQPISRCMIWESPQAPPGGNEWKLRQDRSWRDPGFTQEGLHPVVCVSWDDANAYANWLARKAGKPYRLLSEAEWEYATRGRTTPGAYPRFWFGNDEKDLCRYGNGPDQKARDSLPGTQTWTFAPCNDGYAYTSPAGHYAPNAFGLYDMAGNAYQWTADCRHDSYNGAPADGSAWTSDCDGLHVIRGGAWYNHPRLLRAAYRASYSNEFNDVGIRVARTLSAGGSAITVSPGVH